MSELPHIDRRRFDGLSLTVIDTGVTEWRASYNAPRSEWVRKAASIDPEGWVRFTQMRCIFKRTRHRSSSTHGWPNDTLSVELGQDFRLKPTAI